MAILTVPNRITGESVDVKVDEDCLKKVSGYKYSIDKYSKKPFREVRNKNRITRFFLDRDILNLMLNDGVMVLHENGDPLDCRRGNLITKERNLSTVSSSGNRWPHKIESLIHFLEKREFEDPEIPTAVEFLAKVDVGKFSRKQINIVANEEDYNEYKSKNVDRVIKRVLVKYFDWKGQLHVTKQIAPITPVEKILQEAKEAKEVNKESIGEKELLVGEETIKDTGETEAPIPLETKRAFSNTPQGIKSAFKNTPTSEAYYDYEENVPQYQTNQTDVLKIKRQLYSLSFSDANSVLELLKDNKIFPTECLIRVLQERGANMVQFAIR